MQNICSMIDNTDNKLFPREIEVNKLSIGEARALFNDMNAFTRPIHTSQFEFVLTQVELKKVESICSIYEYIFTVVFKDKSPDCEHESCHDAIVKYYYHGERHKFSIENDKKDDAVHLIEQWTQIRNNTDIYLPTDFLADVHAAKKIQAELKRIFFFTE
jgi:hypothetical protein